MARLAESHETKGDREDAKPREKREGRAFNFASRGQVPQERGGTRYKWIFLGVLALLAQFRDHRTQENFFASSFAASRLRGRLGSIPDVHLPSAQAHEDIGMKPALRS